MVAPFLVEAPGIKKLEKIKKDVAKIGKKIGDSIGNTGRKMTMGLTIPILAAAGASVKLSTDANRSLASIGTLIPGQRDKLETYRKELDSLAVSSATAFVELSDGLYQSISALGDGAQAMTTLKVANKGAKAGLASTKDAISLISGVAKGYNDVSDQMIEKTSDLAFTTVRLGVTTFPELAASMGKVTPIASVLGVSVEELFGHMATLTGVTGETAEVSTQLASIMGRLLKGGDGLDQVYKKLGAKSGQDLIDKTGGLQQALLAMKGAVGGSTAAFSKLLGRKEAILAGLTLTGVQAENAKVKINAMKNAIGATDAAYREQTDGINKGEFQFKKFIETLKSLGRAIGDKIIPILSRWGEKFSPIIDKIIQMDDATLEMYMKIAGAVAVVGPALMVFGKLFTVISGLVGVISGGGGLAGVLVTLTGPVGAVAAALLGAGAAVAYFWDELKPVRDAVKGEVLGMFGELSIKTGAVKTDFSELGDTMKEFVKFAAPVWAVMAKIWIKVHTSPMMLIFRQFKKIIGVAKNLIKIFHSVKTVFVAVGDLIGVLWGKFEEWFSGMETKFPVLEKIRDVFSEIADKIKFVIDGIKEVGKSIVNAPSIVTDFLAEKAGAISGRVARFAADEKRDTMAGSLGGFRPDKKSETVRDPFRVFRPDEKKDYSKGKEDKSELIIKVTSDGAKTGVTYRGKKAKIRGNNGPIATAESI